MKDLHLLENTPTSIRIEESRVLARRHGAHLPLSLGQVRPVL